MVCMTNTETSHSICDSACWEAREEVCRCSCSGKHHGKGVIVRTTQRNGVTYRLVAIGWIYAMREQARTMPGAIVESVTRKHWGWAEVAPLVQRGAQAQAILWAATNDTRKAA